MRHRSLLRRSLLPCALAAGLLAIATGAAESAPLPLPEPHVDTVLAEGYGLRPVTAGIPVPTTIELGPDGDLYVASLAGTVFRVDLDAAVLAVPVPVVTGLDSPVGMAFGADGNLYVSATNPDHGEDRQLSMVVGFDVVDHAGTAPLQLADGRRVLDRVPTGIHPLGGIQLGPDGLLYVAVGSASLNGDSAPGEVPETEPVTMGILRFDPADAIAGPLDALDHRGSGGAADDPVDVVAHGIHNGHDIAFVGGTLFSASNAPQDMEPFGEDVLVAVPDAAGRSLAAGTDLDFGSPGCLWRTGADGHPVSAPSTYPSLPAAERTCEGRAPIATTLGLHVGSTGITAAPSTAGPVADDLFVALWGNLVPTAETPLAGHKVVRVAVAADGSLERDAQCRPIVEDVLAGVLPIDVEAVGSTVYVADMAAGAVLALTLPDGPVGAPTPVACP